MELQEQMMLQLWLTNLRAKLEAGQIEEVKQELDIAVGRIQEDRNAIDNSNRSIATSEGVTGLSKGLRGTFAQALNSAYSRLRRKDSGRSKQDQTP